MQLAACMLLEHIKRFQEINPRPIQTSKLMQVGTYAVFDSVLLALMPAARLARRTPAP